MATEEAVKLLKYFHIKGPTRIADLKVEVARDFGIAESTAGFRLSSLKELGWVSRGTVGVFHYYELTDHGKRLYFNELEQGKIKREEVRTVSSNPDYLHKDEVNRQLEKMRVDLGLPVIPPEGMVFEPGDLSYAMFKHLTETSLNSGEMTFAVVPRGQDLKTIERPENKRPISRRIRSWREVKEEKESDKARILKLEQKLRELGEDI